MAMSQRLEMMLYHGLDATGSIELSTTSGAGPWTKLTLTTAKSVTDAMAEWQTLAAAAFGTLVPSFGWYDDGGDIRHFFGGAIGFWVRLSATMAELFGFAGTVLDASVSKYVETPGGLISHCVLRSSSNGELPISIGHTQPLDVESSDLEAVRAGRALTYHFGRAVEVEVDIAVPPLLYTELVNSSILSGHCAFLLVDDDDPAAYSESHLGGSLLCYPFQTPRKDQRSPDDYMIITHRCSMEDPA